MGNFIRSTLLRRTFISSPAVIATAAAVIASSTTYDPILTAIEQYRCACDMLETIDQHAEPAAYTLLSARNGLATIRHQVRFLSGNTFKRTDSVAATVG